MLAHALQLNRKGRRVLPSPCVAELARQALDLKTKLSNFQHFPAVLLHFFVSPGVCVWEDDLLVHIASTFKYGYPALSGELRSIIRVQRKRRSR